MPEAIRAALASVEEPVAILPRKESSIVYANQALMDRVGAKSPLDGSSYWALMDSAYARWSAKKNRTQIDEKLFVFVDLRNQQTGTLVPLVGQIVKFEQSGLRKLMAIIHRPRRIHLTLRQRDILEFLACGHSAEETSAALGIGLEAVRHHLRSAYAKAGVASLAELIGLLLSGEELRHARLWR